MKGEEVDVIDRVGVTELSTAIDNAIGLGYYVKVEPVIYEATKELSYQITLLREI